MGLNSLITLLAIFALVISCVWLVFEPGFESALAAVVSLSAFFASLVVSKRRENKQSQKTDKGSVGIQAGGDVFIGDIRNDKDA